ncbi:MAG TPA: hypothetical protein P5277_01745 [Candidatus Paceibacterota bacterium]|nr:hypothetical protein [Candidatus Paceibacterota bacterium]
MDKSKELIMKGDWYFKGYLTRILGYIIILGGILIGIYMYIFKDFKGIELFWIIILSLIFGGLFLLISWIYLPFKKK